MNSPQPPPRFATAGLEGLGLALLAASSYNAARGNLWARLQACATVPEPAELEQELATLRDLLREAGCPRGVMREDEAGRAVLRAARRLDAVDFAAADARLLP